MPNMLKGKEFKLSGWPELPPSYRRTSYRRMLDDLSLHYVSLPQLARRSGASQHEVRGLLRELAGRGLLQERRTTPPAEAGWRATLRRWFSGSPWRG
jgi:hypothetical protein